MYYREANPSRVISDDFTLHALINSSTTRLCVCFADCVNVAADGTKAVIGGLNAGRAYEVLVLAGDSDGEEQVGTRLVLTTLSLTNDVADDSSEGVSITIIAAASASAVVVLIIIVLIVVVITRRQRRTDAKIEEISGTSGAVRTILFSGFTYLICDCRSPWWRIRRTLCPLTIHRMTQRARRSLCMMIKPLDPRLIWWRIPTLCCPTIGMWCSPALLFTYEYYTLLMTLSDMLVGVAEQFYTASDNVRRQHREARYSSGLS